MDEIVTTFQGQRLRVVEAYSLKANETLTLELADTEIGQVDLPDVFHNLAIQTAYAMNGMGIYHKPMIDVARAELMAALPGVIRNLDQTRTKFFSLFKSTPDDVFRIFDEANENHVVRVGDFTATNYVRIAFYIAHEYLSPLRYIFDPSCGAKEVRTIKFDDREIIERWPQLRQLFEFENKFGRVDYNELRMQLQAEWRRCVKIWETETGTKRPADGERLTKSTPPAIPATLSPHIPKLTDERTNDPPPKYKTPELEQLAAWVSDNFVKIQRRVLLLTIERGGACPLLDLALDSAINWPPTIAECTDPFNRLCTHVNKKLKSQGFKLHRHNNGSKLSPIGRK